MLHLHNEYYYLVAIVLAGLRYSRAYVGWAGIATALCFVGGVVWLAEANGLAITFTSQDAFAAMPPAEAAAFITDPNRIEGSEVIEQTLLMVIVAGMVAALVHRLPTLALRRAAAERAHQSRPPPLAQHGRGAGRHRRALRQRTARERRGAIR
ncbi:MAG: hypothetical protein FJX56_08735 [Alphaproteobacteria bacterium]|nr:hypothetical protein [Alphaproteobacteria bacterium]